MENPRRHRRDGEARGYLILTAIAHAIFGFITSFSIIYFDKIVRAINLCLITLYILYQIVESRTKEEIDEDLIEFLIGMITAIIFFAIAENLHIFSIP
jgi:hypothetical protein